MSVAEITIHLRRNRHTDRPFLRIEGNRPTGMHRIIERLTYLLAAELARDTRLGSAAICVEADGKVWLEGANGDKIENDHFAALLTRAERLVREGGES